MTSASRGDIVLVKFVFADEKGVKHRPGLIVSTDAYHQSRHETILVAITEQRRASAGGRLSNQGLARIGPAPSLDRDRHRANDQAGHDCGTIGQLPADELRVVEDRLREVLAL